MRGLIEGADDYVTKPFSARELLARVRVLGRRAPAGESLDEVQVDGAVIDLARMVVVRGDDARSSLTPREVGIVRWLHRHQDRVVTRAELLEQVFGQRGDLQTRAVDMAIAVLRKKLEADPAQADDDRVRQGRRLRVAPRRTATPMIDTGARARRSVIAAVLIAMALAALLVAWFVAGWADVRVAPARRSRPRRRSPPSSAARISRASSAASSPALIARETAAPVLPLPEPVPRSARGQQRLERHAVAAREPARRPARARLLPDRRARRGHDADDQRRRPRAVRADAPRRESRVPRRGRPRSVAHARAGARARRRSPDDPRAAGADRQQLVPAERGADERLRGAAAARRATRRDHRRQRDDHGVAARVADGAVRGRASARRRARRRHARRPARAGLRRRSRGADELARDARDGDAVAELRHADGADTRSRPAGSSS